MRAVCLLVAIAALGVARPAWSEPSAADAAYEEGRRLYDLREWDQAIAKFKEAYRLRPDAKSMFNIAQAFRLKGDCVEAVNFYRTYKRNFPNEKNLDKVDKFISELDPCAAKQSTKPEPAPKVVQPPPKVVQPPPKVVQPPPKVVQPPPKVVQPQPEPQPQPLPPIVTTPPPAPVSPPTETPRAGAGRRRVGAVLAVGGGMLVAGAGYFALQAKSASDDVSGRTDVPWDPGREDQGKSDDTKAKVLLGIGGVSAVIGLIVYATAPKTTPTGVGVVPQTGGAMLTWSKPL